MSKVYIARGSQDGFTSESVLQALNWLAWEQFIPSQARVFIKPNLTWPVHKPGVTTTPQAIEAVVAALKGRTDHITVGESEGGYHSYHAEEAFQGHGLYDLQSRYGIQVVNLSAGPARTLRVPLGSRLVEVTLPELLLDEVDVFITLPVPKTHVMTGVSLAFKNQWGCIPSPMRLLEHAEFERKVIAINQVLKPRLAIFDGTYFLDGAGPMTGDVVPMGLLIAGDDIGAASLVACQVMQINPWTIRHFRLARQHGMFPASLQEVELNAPLQPFQVRQFKMKRALLDWISLLGFRSAFFGRLFWSSATAGPLHDLLFAVRRIPLFERLLYGPAGSPPAWKQPGHPQP
jgi:uncharacterized protein (DUF362 family)